MYRETIREMTADERSSFAERRDQCRFFPTAKKFVFSMMLYSCGLITSFIWFSTVSPQSSDQSTTIQIVSALLAIVAAFCILRLMWLWSDGLDHVRFSFY